MVALTSRIPLCCPQVEEALQEIWQDALDLPELPSVTADFFSLGGSSLKAGEGVQRRPRALGRVMHPEVRWEVLPEIVGQGYIVNTAIAAMLQQDRQSAS